MKSVADPDPLIEYGAVANKGGGWLPMLWVNGRTLGHSYWPRGYEMDEAEEMALRAAREHVTRYLGDYNPVIRCRPCCVAREERGRHNEDECPLYQ
jgi:hypothetical protein